MATDKMLLLNLKAYPHGQLPSTFHHRFPVPTVMINRPESYCTTYKRQLILTCSSSSNVTRFVIANTMAASSKMLLSTAEQPIYEGGSGVLTPFHADQTTVDAGSSLLFVVENILNQAAHMADTALLDYLENLDEKVSKANFSPRLLCTIKQFFSMDKVIVLSELLALAQNINPTLNLQEMQKVLCNKQYIETPKEIVKAFTGLFFAEDNLQPHTGGSTNKMLSIVTANDPLGDQVEHPNAFAFGNTPAQNPASRPKAARRMASQIAKVPGAKSTYTFYYASTNGAWLDEFYKKASEVANDPLIMNDKHFSIELFRIADHKTEEQVQILSRKEGWYEECPKFLHEDDQSSSSHTGHFALVRDKSKVALQGRGRKILTALEDFRDHWKKNVQSRGFRNSLNDYYNKLP